MNEMNAPARTGVSAGRRRSAWLLVVSVLPVLTALLVAFRGTATFAAALLIYVLAVVVIAVVGGIGPGIVGAVTSFVLANFTLTVPYYTLKVDAFEQVVELLVFVVIAVLVSATVDIGARNRAAAEQHRLEAVEQAARARELAETDRIRSTILAAVSHDLRTPLAGVKAGVSTLRQVDVDWSPQDQAELLESIEAATDRLSGLVTNLLAMSRIQAGALSVRAEQVVLDEVVGSALLSLGPAADSVAVEVPEDLPTTTADPGLLERVVANLVGNGLRFDPRGTKVTSSVANGTVRLAVVDHGPGVPPQRWEEMFQPFHRLEDVERSGGGLGLGLAIARSFCDAMGVGLEPSATPGGGLTMTMVLEVA